MVAFCVLEHLDVIEHIATSIFPSGVSFPLDPLPFQKLGRFSKLVRRLLAYGRICLGGVDNLSESANLQGASASPYDADHNPHRLRADLRGRCDSHKRRRSPVRNA